MTYENNNFLNKLLDKSNPQVESYPQKLSQRGEREKYILST